MQYVVHYPLKLVDIGLMGTLIESAVFVSLYCVCIVKYVLVFA